MEAHEGVDRYEKYIRAWIEDQTTNEEAEEEETFDATSPLWVDSAKFLLGHINRMCYRVHGVMRKTYKKRPGPNEEKWPTFEEAMQKDNLSPFGAVMMTMWLLDSVLPADCRIMVGLAEKIDDNGVVPVVLVMEAGLMVIDPTGLVTGWRPKRLAHVKGWVINRAFDVSGSYSLREVIVTDEELTNRRLNR